MEGTGAGSSAGGSPATVQVLLRWGEPIALRRRHVDPDAGFVVVRESVVEVSNVLTTVRPKSAAGVREVGIPAAIVPDLREHLRRRSCQICVSTCGGGRNRGRTGGRSSARRGRPLGGPTSVSCGRPPRFEAGIDPEVGLRFHDLRHTGNYLTSRGASLREVRARIGHASTRAALIYQHADRVASGASLRDCRRPSPMPWRRPTGTGT